MVILSKYNCPWSLVDCKRPSTSDGIDASHPNSSSMKVKRGFEHWLLGKSYPYGRMNGKEEVVEKEEDGHREIATISGTLVDKCTLINVQEGRQKTNGQVVNRSVELLVPVVVKKQTRRLPTIAPFSSWLLPFTGRRPQRQAGRMPADGRDAPLHGVHVEQGPASPRPSGVLAHDQEQLKLEKLCCAMYLLIIGLAIGVFCVMMYVHGPRTYRQLDPLVPLFTGGQTNQPRRLTSSLPLEQPKLDATFAREEEEKKSETMNGHHDHGFNENEDHVSGSERLPSLESDQLDKQLEKQENHEEKSDSLDPITSDCEQDSQQPVLTISIGNIQQAEQAGHNENHRFDRCLFYDFACFWEAMFDGGEEGETFFDALPSSSLSSSSQDYIEEELQDNPDEHSHLVSDGQGEEEEDVVDSEDEEDLTEDFLEQLLQWFGTNIVCSFRSCSPSSLQAAAATLGMDSENMDQSFGHDGEWPEELVAQEEDEELQTISLRVVVVN